MKFTGENPERVINTKIPITNALWEIFLRVVIDP